MLIFQNTLKRDMKKHKKKHGHQQNIALLTIFKNMSKAQHFNQIFKAYFNHKKVYFSFNPFKNQSINI